MKLFKLAKFLLLFAMIAVGNGTPVEVSFPQCEKGGNMAEYPLFDTPGYGLLETGMEGGKGNACVLDIDGSENQIESAWTQQLLEKRGRHAALLDVLDYMKKPETKEQTVDNNLFAAKPPQKRMKWNSFLYNQKF